MFEVSKDAAQQIDELRREIDAFLDEVRNRETGEDSPGDATKEPDSEVDAA